MEEYLLEFKEDIKNKATELGLLSCPNFSSLLQYIYDYDHLILDKSVFEKRRRLKISVNLGDRCCAKRSNGEQCTRRRKDNATIYCGTHLKGVPHGSCETTEEPDKTQRIEIWEQNIQGILYYIDKHSHVYKMEDILKNKSNPAIIAKYEKHGDTYTIPEFIR